MSYLQQPVIIAADESVRSLDFDWKNPFSASSLSRAVRSNNVEVVAKLIKRGFSVDAPDNRGWTPLHEAAVNNSLCEIARFLISAGAFIEHRTVEGETALIIACRNAAEDIVKLLLDSGCEVNTRNNECFTPLHIACARANQKIIRLLIEAGADINAKDDEERTPIYLAIESVNIAALNILIEAGADIKTKDFFSRTPLQYACMIGNLEIFNILIGLLGRDKSVIDQQTPEGWTLLMEAVQYKNYQIAEKLIEYGTDTTLVDNRQLLALHIAAHCQRYNLIELLLKHTPKHVIEKYSTFGSNMTHYRSLPCLIIDKNVFEGLVLLFQSGLSEDVLKCPAKMGERLVSPISFLLLHATAVEHESKMEFLEFLLSHDFLKDPDYNLQKYHNSEVIVVSPIEAAVTMHRPYEKNCHCAEFLAMMLAHGISPDDPPRFRKKERNTHKKHFLFHKAIRYGFVQGLDLLLRYSECAEPGDILEMFIKDICEKNYLWTGQEIQVINFLVDKCTTELSRAVSYMSNALQRELADDWNRGNAVLQIFDIVKEKVCVPSLKMLCRSSMRKHIAEECDSSGLTIRKYIQNMAIPFSVERYLLYEREF